MTTLPTPTQAEELAKQIYGIAHGFDGAIPNGLISPHDQIRISRLAPVLAQKDARISELNKDLSIAHVCIDERDSLRAANTALAAEVEKRQALIDCFRVQEDGNIGIKAGLRSEIANLRADKLAADGLCGERGTLLIRALGALNAANYECLAERKAEDGRRSESGAPTVDWPKETPYDSIIEQIRAHLTPSAAQNKKETKA